MKELANEITKSAEVLDEIGTDRGVLNIAAKKWASHALDNYTDELLDRALAVSKALVQFTAALEEKDKPFV